MNIEETATGKQTNKLAATVIRDIVRRIVAVAHPEKIILFGSAARDQIGPNSDVDLLVVKRGKFHRGRLTEAVYAALHGAAAVDVILVTPEEVERFRDAHCLVIAPAVREGRVVYGA